MTTPTSEPSTWADVILTQGDEPLVTYRSVLVTYEESLTGGRYVGRGWNGSGFANFYGGRVAQTCPTGKRVHADDRGKSTWRLFCRPLNLRLSAFICG